MQKKKIPQIKKDIKDFLLQEEGNMVKKDVVKMGMGLFVLGLALSAAMKPDPASAECCVNCAPPKFGKQNCPSHCSY